ncbi:MAG: DinB family protein [Gemmatimonadaceae bacterium]|nr:DinB family protein [Gemmatimonadaceae bacterium]
MRTEEMLTKLDRAWKDFEASYAGLTHEQLMIPNVTGAWSVRDIIAHVTWWEEEALKHMPLIREGGRPPRYSDKYGGIDDFNAIMTVKREHLSLEEVLRQHDEVHAQLVAYVGDAPEELYAGDSKFRRRLRLDTYGHYPVHTNAIRAWRAKLDQNAEGKA